MSDGSWEGKTCQHHMGGFFSPFKPCGKPATKWVEYDGESSPRCEDHWEVDRGVHAGD